MPKQFVLALLDKENDVFGIRFPDYPGVISGGVTFGDAVNKGANALVFHIQGMVEDGDPVPTPWPAEVWISSKEISDEIASGTLPAMIEVELPGKAVRVNISIEEGLLSQVDKAASSSGQSRSAFLADAVRTKLRVLA